MSGYVELHAHSAFSFLDGASSPHELAQRAKKLGYEAMALTDHDGLWGSMEFAQACKHEEIHPITGAELTVIADGARGHPEHPSRLAATPRAHPHSARFHLTVLVEGRTGYRNLCRLITLAHADDRENPLLTLDQLSAHAEGLICLSGCARDGALAGRIAAGRASEAEGLGRRLLGIFGRDHLRVEMQRPLWRGDRARNRALAELAERLGVPCVATGDVHAHDRSRVALQDAFVALRLGGTLESTEPERRGNGSAVLIDPERAARRFAEYPEAVAESSRLAERLRGFNLNEDLGYSYPGAEDGSADRRLVEVCEAPFGERYGSLSARKRQDAKARLSEELDLISRLGLSGFFLLHREMLELAREVAVEVRGPGSARAVLPPGRGRGSSVSSVVCYLTGLSHVDPIEANLFLGRFLNDDITAMPDIDLDFPRDIRERLIPRVHERYGPERSALVAAFPTFRSRGAIRELGKVLGLPPGEIERAARSAGRCGSEGGADWIRGSVVNERRWQILGKLIEDAYGLPRHPSQHSGGMIVSTQPLIDVCPIVPAAMEERQIVQWDKDSCADAGFLKIDLLGLGMLSAVERAVDEIGRARDERIDLSRIPLDDGKVFEAIQKAETTGVFQIESRAQMQMLPRSRPESLEDLTVQVAIVRPGPIQGGAVHPYLERRKRLREDPDYEIPYEHPNLQPVLKDTLGAIVFQDQVIQVAIELAGFTPGQAEGLRRAMSRKRSEEAMAEQRERFIEGARRNDVDRETAERVFAQISGFSGFGFPKSHATAFGLLAYQSTWLRVHYGPEFLCSLLNEQPMGFYPPDALVHEAQRRGIEILSPDVNRSAVECRAEWVEGEARKLAVRVGLGYVKDLPKRDAELIVAARDEGGRYRDLGDLTSRSGASREGLRALAWADALTGRLRREALWILGVARGAEGEQLALPLSLPNAPSLPEQTSWERVVADYSSYGMSLHEHPMRIVRNSLDPATTSCEEMEGAPDGEELIVAGIVVARQRPGTAKGVTFLLLEDETGVANVIVLPPVYERHRLAVRTGSILSVAGKLERREGVSNLLASTVVELSAPDVPTATVATIEPDAREEAGKEMADLSAVLPKGHSFGRRQAS